MRDPDARFQAELRDRAVKSYQLDLGKVRREGRIEGRIEGRAEQVSDQLSVKFGPLPAAVVERVQRASESELVHWGRKLLVADSLDAVFVDR
jgi:hypothetical protein